MQILFTVQEGLEEYIKKGKDYPFPPPPVRRCHNNNCKKVVQFKKHGFYQRHLITNIFRDKILIRRYICPLCGMMKDSPDQEYSFTQKFHQTTNKTFLTLCK